MSLRERVLIILFVMFGCYLAMEYAVHQWMVYPEYVHQEQQQTQAELEHAVKVIKNDFMVFQQQIAAAGRSGRYCRTLKEGIAPSRSENNVSVDFVFLYDHKWKPVWDNQDNRDLASLIQRDLLEGESPFITAEKMGFSEKDLFPVNGQFAWVVAEPVLSSPESRTVEGMLIAGQYLSDTYLQHLKDRLELDFSWQILSPEKLQGRPAEIAKYVTAENPYNFSNLGENLVECSTLLWDRQNRPALLVKSFQDRSISTDGQHTIYKLLLIKLVAGLVSVLFLTLLLQRFIIAPILKLIKHIGGAERLTITKNKIAFSRKDEIGTLAREFDHMCSRIQNAQVKLVEKSYYTGLTEMSSGILHNVRNALSPITTRIERIKDQFRNIPLEHLEQAQVELQKGSLSTERRTDLLRFVDLTFQNVIDNLKETVDGLEELSTQVIQIEDMLNSQKTFTAKDKETAVEFIEPIKLIDKAIDMVPDKTQKLCKVKTNQINKLPPIPVHVTTFTQVLQNLIINAGESLERKKSLYSKISITCNIEPAEPIDMLHWIIEDNGAGIEPEKIKAIFERGASSKKTGLTGIGLHWCANTITAMRGKIWAESDGEHRGARFHILIPMAAEEALAPIQQGQE